jgi:hypothetical protein
VELDASCVAASLVAAIAVNFVSIALKGIRWWLFLRAAGVPSFHLHFVRLSPARA